MKMTMHIPTLSLTFNPSLNLTILDTVQIGDRPDR